MLQTKKLVKVFSAAAAAAVLCLSLLCEDPIVVFADAWSFQRSHSSSNNNSSNNKSKGRSNKSSSTSLSSSSRKEFLQKTAVVGATATAAAALSAVGVLGLAWPARAAADNVGGTIRYGDESIMAPKEHGTSSKPVQSDLLYGVSVKLADKICNFNRHFAEMGGYFQSTTFEQQVLEAKGPLTFYDSVTGKPLFVAPINRSPEQFIQESKIHGWPSFRDDEVVWDNVRVLKSSGETVSVDGTHLGHNLPDRNGNRYCINLVSIAGKPV